MKRTRIELGCVVFLVLSATALASFAAAAPASPTTEVVVHVYKLLGGQPPFWHSGVVIDNIEYYFDDSGKVMEDDQPGTFNHDHHRTIRRTVQGNLADVKAVFQAVRARWHGSRYDVSKHNCNYFVNEVLVALGAEQLDREYLDCSGLAKGWRQLPGGATVAEISKQLMQGKLDARPLGPALLEDARRAARLPTDTVDETGRFAETAIDEAERASDAAKKAAQKARDDAAAESERAAKVAREASEAAAKAAQKARDDAAAEAERVANAAREARKAAAKAAQKARDDAAAEAERVAKAARKAREATAKAAQKARDDAAKAAKDAPKKVVNTVRKKLKF